MSYQVHERNDFTKEISSEFLKSVYGYMFSALAISGIIAYFAGTPAFFKEWFVSASGGISPMFYIVAFAPVALGWFIQGAYNRLSLGALMFLFVVYSALMGLSLSVVFLAYSEATIASTFFISAGAFGGMAILGYTTKTDLTKFGSLMYMLFFGIIIAWIVNIFMHSGKLSFLIGVLGVFVFTGLTAYYMQQFKKISQDANISALERSKLTIVGGLMLYILFINLFLSLLRILGSRE